MSSSSNSIRAHAEEISETSQLNPSNVTTSEVVEATSSIATSTAVSNTESSSFDVKDYVEKYYDENIRDKYMFGVSLGALIGMLGTFVTSFYQIYKTKKSCKTQEDNQAVIEAKIEAYNNIVESYKKISEEMNAEGKAYVEKYKALVKEQTEKLDKCAEKLENFSEIQDTLYDLCDIISLLSETDEYIRKGVAEEIRNITNKVK